MPNDRILRRDQRKYPRPAAQRRFHKPRYIIEDLDTFKSIIVGLREEALKDLETLQQEELQQNPPDDIPHRKAPSAHSTNQLEQQVSHQVELVEQLNAALERIRGKEYGCCEQCGLVIDKMRLMAVPHTRRCFACNRDVKTGVHRFNPN